METMYDADLRHYENLMEMNEYFNESFFKNMFAVALHALEEDFPNYPTDQKVKDLYLDIVTHAEFIIREDDPTIINPVHKKTLFEMVNSVEYNEIDPLYDPIEDIQKRWSFSYMWTMSNALDNWIKYQQVK